jgi:hypothetical protein
LRSRYVVRVEALEHRTRQTKQLVVGPFNPESADDEVEARRLRNVVALVADLAPASLVGRYMALNGFSWQLGFITGPADAAAVLGAEPHAVWLLAAGVCLLGTLGAYRLERRLPAEAAITPA